MKISYSLIALFCTAIFVTGCGDKSEPAQTGDSSTAASSSAAQTSNPAQEQVIIDFFNAVAAGQPEKVIELIDISEANGAQAAQSQNKLKLLIAEEKAKIDAKGGLKSVKVKKASDTAAKPNMYEVELTFTDNSTQESIIEVFQAGSNWKIQM